MTALEFERKANFLNCLGAVDGKHIRVIKENDMQSNTCVSREVYLMTTGSAKKMYTHFNERKLYVV